MAPSREIPNEPAPPADPGYWHALEAEFGHVENEHSLDPRAIPRPDGQVLPGSLDLDELLDSDDEPYDWIVARLIERGDRTIVTGPEGGGKSTFLKQFGVALASGIHPFTLDDIDPVNVLLVDVENSTRQNRRGLAPLRAAAGDRYRPGGFRIISVGGAVEIANPMVEDDLADRLDRHAVDVLLVGPLYKMATGDPIKEEPARVLADALDRLRAVRGSALLIEAHTPYASGPKAKRQHRPYGASLWSRWPEFGIHLDPAGELEHWRGQRDEREWPTRLLRDTPSPWPWVVGEAPDRPQWDGPTECIAAVTELFRTHLDDGVELGPRPVMEALRDRGLGYRERTVRDALSILCSRGVLVSRMGPRNAHLYRLSTVLEEIGGTDDLF